MLTLPGWVQSIITCPVCKSDGLTEADNSGCPKCLDRQWLCRSCGSHYPIQDGEPVLIPFVCSTSRSHAMEQWQSAQRQFVAWQAEYSRENAAADLRGADDIHAQFELTGRVLDIGGSAGLARRYLTDAQPYLSVDPDRSWRQRLDVYASVYPGVAKPFAQVQALAEQLPLRSQTFDSILMRSVIDHCYDAHLALSEAYRVLNPGGRLVIGLSVGGRRARARALIPKFGAKGAGIEIARRVRSFARSGFRWHGTGHVFHIDGDDVPALLGEHGFRMVKQVTSSLIPTVAFFEVTRPVDARE